MAYSRTVNYQLVKMLTKVDFKSEKKDFDSDI